MEPDNRVALAPENRSDPVTRPGAASDLRTGRNPDHGHESDSARDLEKSTAQTPVHEPDQSDRGGIRGMILGGGLVAVLALGALGYFYFRPRWRQRGCFRSPGALP